MSTQDQNQYLHYLVDPIFQGVNGFSVLLCEDIVHRIRDI